MRGITASKAFQRLTLVDHLGPVRRNVHVGPQIVDDLHFVPPLLARLFQSLRRKELCIAGKNRNFHTNRGALQTEIRPGGNALWAACENVTRGGDAVGNPRDAIAVRGQRAGRRSCAKAAGNYLAWSR
jgi:hypothetical protein